MTRHVVPASLAIALGLAVSLAHGEPRGGRGAKPGGGQPPGGNWSERTHSGRSGQGQTGQAPQGAGAAAAAGHFGGKNNTPQASGAQGAAAGAAVTKRHEPQATGAQGAAAGAAVTKRNEPQATGAQGAAAGAAVAKRNEPAMSGAGGAAAGYAAVRNNFRHPNYYGQEWYGAHPRAWTNPRWAAGAVWVPSSWGAIATQCGYGTVAPISYNYGVNVTALNGNVMVDGQSAGTVAEFSQQAAALAEAGTEAPTSDTDQWLSLGVFAMVRDERQQPQLIVQLAINQQGILRGNFTDEVSNVTSPIHGAADKQSQRAAWTVGDNRQTVMEAGLNDLTQSEAPALIHNNGKTDHWILVRLEQPK